MIGCLVVREYCFCSSLSFNKEYRMRIVQLIFLCSIVLVEVSSDEICGDGWKFSYGHCYTYPGESGGTLEYATTECEKLGGYVMVPNTEEEIHALIDDGVINNGAPYLLGVKTFDNGTTFKNLDGSTEASFVESVAPSLIANDIDHIECGLYRMSSQICFWVDSVSVNHYYHCEKEVFFNDGPCKFKQRKLRHGATRKLSFDNTKSRMCYFDIKRDHFKPAQLKIFGYNFPTGSDLCSKGFFVQNGGEMIEVALKEDLTCGRDGGTGRPLMKLRSGKGGTIRLYVALDGDGEKVWLRVKARRFMRSVPF